MPNQVCAITIPIAKRWVNLNQGFLTQRHPLKPPHKISTSPKTTNTTNNVCSINTKSDKTQNKTFSFIKATSIKTSSTRNKHLIVSM